MRRLYDKMFPRKAVGGPLADAPTGDEKVC
jgi:hypothetical protein